MSDASNAEKTRGRPFQPGNPGGGRPKMPDELKEAFKAAAPKALQTLMDILDNGDKNADRLRAAEVLLDRGYGKPVQAIEAEITDLRPIVFDAALGGIVKPNAPNR